MVVRGQDDNNEIAWNSYCRRDYVGPHVEAIESEAQKGTTTSSD